MGDQQQPVKKPAAAESGINANTAAPPPRANDAMVIPVWQSCSGSSLPTGSSNKNCLWCPFSSPRLCDLLTHMKTTHPADYAANDEVAPTSSHGSKQYRCFGCDATFSRTGNLMDHVSKYHSESNTDLQVSSESSLSASLGASQSSFSSSSITTSSRKRHLGPPPPKFSRQCSVEELLAQTRAHRAALDSALSADSDTLQSSSGSSTSAGLLVNGSNPSDTARLAGEATSASALTPSAHRLSSSSGSSGLPFGRSAVQNSVVPPGHHICPYCKLNKESVSDLIQHLSDIHQVSSGSKDSDDPRSKANKSSTLSNDKILPGLTSNTNSKLKRLAGKHPIFDRLVSAIYEPGSSSIQTEKEDIAEDHALFVESSSASMSQSVVMVGTDSREHHPPRHNFRNGSEWSGEGPSQVTSGNGGPGGPPQPPMSRDKKYKCFWCDQTFRKRGKLMDHIDEMHKHTKDQNELEAEILSYNDKDTPHKAALLPSFVQPMPVSHLGSSSELGTSAGTLRISRMMPGGHLAPRPTDYSANLRGEYSGSTSGRAAFPEPIPQPPPPPSKVCRFERAAPLHRKKLTTKTLGVKKGGVCKFYSKCRGANPLNARLPRSYSRLSAQHSTRSSTPSSSQQQHHSQQSQHAQDLSEHVQQQQHTAAAIAAAQAQAVATAELRAHSSNPFHNPLLYMYTQQQFQLAAQQMSMNAAERHAAERHAAIFQLHYPTSNPTAPPDQQSPFFPGFSVPGASNSAVLRPSLYPGHLSANTGNSIPASSTNGDYNHSSQHGPLSDITPGHPSSQRVPLPAQPVPSSRLAVSLSRQTSHQHPSPTHPSPTSQQLAQRQSPRVPYYMDFPLDLSGKKNNAKGDEDRY